MTNYRIFTSGNGILIRSTIYSFVAVKLKSIPQSEPVIPNVQHIMLDYLSYLFVTGLCGVVMVMLLALIIAGYLEVPMFSSKRFS